jgi:hypothetical protein
MYVGAAASLIGIAVDLAVIGRLRDQIATHSTRNGRALTPAQVTTLEHVEIGAIIVAALITVGLWIWMARSVAAARCPAAAARPASTGSSSGSSAWSRSSCSGSARRPPTSAVPRPSC